jgi:hypothetical protein
VTRFATIEAVGSIVIRARRGPESIGLPGAFTREGVHEEVSPPGVPT